MNSSFCIQTRHGNAFDPEAGKINNIDINDVAHALSNICRYAGHCRKFYSVAEHSVLVSRIIRKLWPTDVESRWAGLLHDATEAYVGDVPTPLKVLLPDYSDIEDELAKKIAKKFRIKWTKTIHSRVKIADLIALSTEAQKLFADVSHWAAIKNYEAMPELLSKNFPVSPETGKRRFLAEFKKVQQELKNARK